MMYETCVIPDCQHDCSYKYYGHWICELCWLRHCNDDDVFDLKKILNTTEQKERRGV